MTDYRTLEGRILTDDDIQKLADEAEEGYEIDILTPISDERRKELRRHIEEARENETF